MANLPNLTPRILQNTLRLVKFYNTNPKFKELFDKLVPNPKVIYQGLPLKIYLRVITSTSLKYRKYEKEVRADPDKFKELLILFYKDPKEFGKFEKTVQGAILGKNIPQFLTEEEVKLIEQIEKTPEGKEKQSHISQLEQKLRSSQPKEERVPQIILPKIQIPSLAKEVGSKGQIALRNAAYAYGPKILSGGIKGAGLAGRALLGIGVRGVALAAGPVGWAFVALTTLPEGIEIAKKVLSTTKKIAIYGGAAVGVVLILMMPGGLLQTNALLPPFATLGEAAPLPGGQPVPGGQIGSGCPDTSNNKNGFSCRYLNPSINIFDTNISQGVIDLYIKNYSSLFINAKIGDINEFKKRVDYIVTKSKQGGLNPVLFLGYWKTESNFSTMGTRDMGCVGDGFYEQVRCALAIDEYADPIKNPVANCARSEKADTPACNALKSIRSTFDKTHPVSYPIRSFDDFTESYGPYDHLTGGLPTNCISTYNKLIDVAKELSACKVNQTTPPATNTATLRSDIQKEFAINFDSSFSENVLRWAWEVLWQARSNAPRFFDLINKSGFSEIKITPINGTTETFNFKGEIGINNERSIANEGLFKQIFIHELGHIIHGPSGSPRNSQYDTGINQAITNEGYLTRYSSTCLRNPDEDFAETISYFINNKLAEQPTGSCGALQSPINPFDTGKYPYHLEFAKKLLIGDNF